MDILIQNGLVIDGTGKEPFPANIGVKEGKIEYIGSDTYAASRVIDVSGQYVAPGFIDMHSHSDYTLPVYPDAESALGQGVTTMVAGNCGMSPSPCPNFYIPFCFEEAAMARVLPEPIGGINPGFMQMCHPSLLRPHYQSLFGTDLDWTSFSEYAAHLRRAGIAPNLIAMVGHGTIRCQAMGADIHRAATPAEIEEMVRLCDSSMQEGAAGVSFGLDYDPGGYADDAELEAIASCVARHGKILATHYQLRPVRRGVTTEHSTVDGILEMLRLAKRTGVHLHLSHLTASFTIKPYDRELERLSVLRVLEIIESYRADGVYVTYDTIPSYTGGDFFYPNIAQRFLPYVLQAGGMERFSQALRTGNYKEMLIDDICAGKHASSSVMTYLNPVTMPNWGAGAVITRCADRSLEGKTIGELCRTSGKNHVRLLLDILSQDPYACYNMWGGQVPGVDTEVFLSTPDMAIGMDVSSVDYTLRGSFDDDRPQNKRSTGTYCCFIKYLSSGRQPIEDLVRHLTSVPADILHLADRGRIAQGNVADITVFDAQRLRANEDFLEPAQRPAGISYVLVDGKLAMEQGVHTHIRSGSVII